MKILIRKIKAFLTGKKPCTFETANGHDFERVSEITKTCLGDHALFECKVCGQKAIYSQFDGAFVAF
jgi:hypothetical protein